jgi:hypothetical protein
MVHLFFLLSMMRFYISRKMNTRFTFSTRFLLYTTMGTGARKYQTLLRLSFFALLLFNGQGQVCQPLRQRFSQAVQL